jgi:membrane-associated phospholipid phosphatase
VVGLLIPIMVASCRMYRGMHYPTDTATSFLLGLSLLAIAFHALPLSGGRPDEDRDRRRRAATTSGPSTDEFVRTRP